MVLIEFRVPLPLAVGEFQVAQLYMVIKASAAATGDGEGVEWLKNEPYDNTDGHLGVSEITNTDVPRTRGQYTLKRYHIASKVPAIARALVPTDSLILIEEAWNAYPHCKTVLCNAYLSKDKFQVIVETMHIADNGGTENALNLSPAALKLREVRTLDILDDIDTAAATYKAEEDPRVYVSKSTGRGRLVKGWQRAHDPVMTCYKLVSVNFKYFGAQGIVEGQTVSSQERLFRQTLRQAFTLLDEWHGLNMADIRRLEAESKEALNAKRALPAEPGPLSAAGGTPAAAAGGAAGGGGGGGSGGAEGASESKEKTA